MKHIATIFILCVIATGAWADDRSEWILREKAKTSDERVNAASDASFDKRLPPVIPGEEVNDSGKRTKVWSTSGSVSDDNDDFARTRKPGARLDDVDVLVDGRDTRR